MTPRPRSAHRELTDFLVMALAVVFLLRTFVGEPFGVPTGSMAPTLLGAHKLIHCPECNKTFPVGSDENSGEAVVCLCPACGTKLDIASAPVKAGSRIMVMKGPPTPLKRWDVAVFKFVDEPRKFYVKRIIGLPGERLRIKGGEIELWNEDDKRWHIARKPAELAKEMAIPVWEEEFQKKGAPEAWSRWPTNAWKEANAGWAIEEKGRLQFQHRSPTGRPILIGDNLGYNFGLSATQADNADVYWNRSSSPVGDLHVSLTVEPSDTISEVSVLLLRAEKEYRLRIGSAMIRLEVSDKNVREWRRTSWNAKRRFRFAHVDRRLLVWINDEMLGEWCDDDQEMDDHFPLAFEGRGPTPVSRDLAPIMIETNARGARITDLRVYRDVYYTQQAGATDFLQTDAGRDMMGDVNEFKRFREARQRSTEFTVPPNCYFALGDNSDRSLDGRHWKHSHFIEERMIVGRVLFKLGR